MSKVVADVESRVIHSTQMNLAGRKIPSLPHVTHSTRVTDR